jgi:hypothetical protein
MDAFTLTAAELPHAWTLLKVCVVFAVLAIVVAVVEK